VFASDKPFLPSLLFVGRPGVYPRDKHLKDVSLTDGTNKLGHWILLGLKFLQETNTLAFWTHMSRRTLML